MNTVLAGVRKAVRRGLLGLGIATVVAGAAQAGSPLSRYDDVDLAHGFLGTVFGSELASAGRGIVKKFDGPVRFEIVNRAVVDHSREVAGFVRQLPRKIAGLDARLAAPGEQANFRVVVVDPGAYVQEARAEGLGGLFKPVHGFCNVQITFSKGAIRQATAVIVANERFARCLVEEILQGLGPINDDSRLTHSVFNDRSGHSRLTAFDRAIVTMLYDPRVAHGMSQREAMAILPDLIARARQLIR